MISLIAKPASNEAGPAAAIAPATPSRRPWMRASISAALFRGAGSDSAASASKSAHISASAAVSALRRAMSRHTAACVSSSIPFPLVGVATATVEAAGRALKGAPRSRCSLGATA